MQFFNNWMWKITDQVSGAGIRTRDLLVMSLV